MEIKITEQKKDIIEDNKKVGEEVINKNIGFPDEKGKLRWLTEDELKRKFNHLKKVIEEVDK